MIAYIKGKIIDIEEKSLIVETSGVGYKIFTTKEIILSKKEGDDAVFWIHHITREDTEDLYGFEDKKEKFIFELLLSVSGIGPKSALNILSISSTESLRSAIITGETGHLTKVSGISKKIADKIVLELKGKLGDEQSIHSGLKEEVDTIEALKSLGFSHKDAREVLKDLPPNLSTSEKIKEALKKLSK